MFFLRKTTMVKFGFILGPAGSGKSLMTAALHHWMELVELDVATLNLDPGVKVLPYAPDIDVREYIDIEKIIDKYMLGPNGALMAAMDHVLTVIDKIIDDIEALGPEYVLVDTPGQMEIFAYRQSGPVIQKLLLGNDNLGGGLFLIDPTLATTPSSFVSILLLALSVSYRLDLPQALLITKGDLVEAEFRKKIVAWSEDPEALYLALLNEPHQLEAELGREITQVLANHGFIGEFPLVSAETNENMDVAFGILQRMWGDDHQVFG